MTGLNQLPSMNILASEAMSEFIVRHLFRDKECLDLALSFNMKGEDFLTSQIAGIKIYSIFADIIFAIKEAPVAQDLLKIHLQTKFNDNSFSQFDYENVANLMLAINNSELNVEYFKSILPEFIGFRRRQKAVIDNASNVNELHKKLNQIAFECTQFESGPIGEIYNPFDAPVVKTFEEVMTTGFDHLDSHIRGISKQQLGYIMAPSGGGKTCMAVGMMKHSALCQKKVYFFSAEEPAVDVIQRLYANVFEINYSDLHSGKPEAIALLRESFELPRYQPIIESLRGNLLIDDVRDLTPMTTETLRARLELKCKERNFYPDLIIFDQMDYMTTVSDAESGWEKQGNLSFELDKFSQYKINDQYTFALWVIHQIKGKMKLDYNVEDISGFKGIIKPADIAIVLGRESPTSVKARISTIKSRHSKNVFIDYILQMEFMRIKHVSEYTDTQSMDTSQFTSPQSNPTAATSVIPLPTLVINNENVTNIPNAVI